MIFALCGGDERQVRLLRQLREDGHEVRALALDEAALPMGAAVCETAEEALSGADCVVLPLPASRKRGCLSCPLSSGEWSLAEIFASVSEGQLVCAGMADEALYSLAEKSGAVLRDYYEREELLAVNAAATAEGAVAVLLSETEGALYGRSVLITGWGRVARALAPRLNGMAMRVAVAARREADRAWIASLGYDDLDIERLGENLRVFDAAVNTVPAPVLTAGVLSELKPGTLVVELASKPGGVDFEAARAFGLRAVRAPGLPTKYAPETAAAAIRRALYSIIGEERA